jgi:hypothetical protein
MAMANSDYIAKFDRARCYLEELNTSIEGFFSKDHCTVINEKDPDGGPNSFRVRVIVDTPPIEFSLAMGDILHNLRGTLDHLVYAMAEAAVHPQPLSQDIAKKSEFPIIGDTNTHGIPGAGKKMFADARHTKLRGISPQAQAVIESLQPYHRGSQFESHPLWALHELSNIDKHRTLLIGTLSNAATMLNPGVSFNYRLIEDVIQAYGVLLEPEAVIIRYAAVPRDPSKEMHVEFGPLLEIVFNCGSSLDRKNTLKILFDTYNFVESEVIPRLSSFL